ncbi:MAG: hypothetical protein JJU28_07525 [Cyclobacteriaceae bacterium]|nr:hypothetical protein [Cyclobacteriaceae bacterium]
MKTIKISSFISVFIFTQIYFEGYSQKSNCDRLIQHGVSNVVNVHSSRALNETRYSYLSDVDIENADERTIVQLEAKVFGVGSGGGGLTIEKRRQRLLEKKQELFMQMGQNAVIDMKSRLLYDRALAAWERCLELEGRKEFVTQYDFDDLGNKVSIKLTYIGAAGESGRSALKWYGSDVEGFSNPIIKSTGKFQTDSLIDNRSATFIFNRNEPEEINLDGYSYKRYKSGSIILAVAGHNNDIRLDFPEIIQGPLNSPTRPGVGDIVASILPIDVFLNLNNNPNLHIHWMLANGDPIDISYAYNRDLGFANVPDLRGLFLRGKNYGRFPANQVTEMSLNQFQKDLTAKPTNFAIAENGAHDHYSGIVGNSTLAQSYPYSKTENQGLGFYVAAFGNAATHWVYTGLKTQSVGNHNHTISGWDPETIPKNITVNYFIRVN